MKRFTSLCLALASLAAVGVAVSAARPQYGGTLRVEIEAAVGNLDPSSAASSDAQDAARARVSPLVFEALTTIEPDGLRPLLATSWQPEARGTRWRLRVRGGIVLHDGSTLQPWQVAASIRASEPAWKAAAEGDAIVIDTGDPVPDLPWAIADARHAIVVRGAGGALVGSAPFRIDHVDPSRILLKAHEAYWRARPFVDAVQIDTARRPEAQLADLEGGRADVVGVRAIDARRLTRRGLRVEASRPLELVALVFEPNRAGEAALAWRRTLAATINRDAICSVVLQGQGAPARSALPAWLSGYARAIALNDTAALSPSAVAALPLDQRTVMVRVDPADLVTQAIAERLAVDAREAGFAVKVQAPVGLAPRPDARLVRIAAPATTPDRAFASIADRLSARGGPAIAPAPGAALDATYRAEQALLDRLVVVPIVHVPELYGVGDRVGATAPIARPLGGWDLANVWLQGGRP